jgi:hypothetical protein
MVSAHLNKALCVGNDGWLQWMQAEREEPHEKCHSFLSRTDKNSVSVFRIFVARRDPFPSMDFFEFRVHVLIPRRL